MADLTPAQVHSHPHTHETAPASTWQPGFSLLRLSAGARLMGAGVLVAAIWAGVLWAILP